MKAKSAVRLVLLAAVLTVAGLTATFFATSNQPLIGVGGEDGELGGEFTLTSVNGPVSLSDFKGKTVVVYFGFVNCEKVCPASMGVLQNVMQKLEADELEQVQALLVSIDPSRDTQESLQEFTQKYHANIMGLTGSQEQIDQVARDYGAHFEQRPSETDESEYGFHHSSRYYVINAEGQLVDAMRHSTTSNELVARIRTII